jgi:DNA repair exonuclease SbcCD ATPase subunit
MSGKSTLNIGVNVQPLINETEIRKTIQERFNRLPATSVKIEPDTKSFDEYIQDIFTKEYPIQVTASVGNLETLKTQIGDEIQKINDDASMSTVKINIDSKGLAENLSKNIKDNLKVFNSEIKSSLKNLTLNSVAINTALDGFFPEEKEMSRLTKQAEKYQKDIDKTNDKLAQFQKIKKSLYNSDSDDTREIATKFVNQEISFLRDNIKVVADIDDIFYDDESGLKESVVKEKFKKIVSYYDEVYSYMTNLQNNFNSKSNTGKFLTDNFVNPVNFDEINDLEELVSKIRNYLSTPDSSLDINTFLTKISPDISDDSLVFDSISAISNSLTKFNNELINFESEQKRFKKTRAELLKNTNDNIQHIAEFSDAKSTIDTGTADGKETTNKSTIDSKTEERKKTLVELLQAVATAQGQITEAKDKTLTKDAELKVAMEDQLEIANDILAASQKIKTIWSGSDNKSDGNKLINDIGQDKVENPAQTEPKDTFKVLEKLQNGVATITDIKFDVDPKTLQESVNEVFKDIKAPVVPTLTTAEADSTAVEKSKAVTTTEAPIIQPDAIKVTKQKKTNKEKTAEAPVAEPTVISNTAKSTETLTDIGAGKISKISFDIDQKTLQASVDTLFEKIQALIKNIKLSSSAIESIQKQIQEAANKEVSISPANVTVDNATIDTKDKQKSINLNNVIGVVSNLGIDPNKESITKIQQELDTFANNFTLTIPNITISNDSVQDVYKKVADALSNIPISFSTNSTSTTTDTNTEQSVQTSETTKPKKTRRSKKAKAEPVKSENWDNFEQITLDEVAAQATETSNSDKSSSVISSDYTELINGIKTTLDEFLTKLSSITITTTSATTDVKTPITEGSTSVANISPKIIKSKSISEVTTALGDYQQKLGELIVAQELLLQWTDELSNAFTEQNVALGGLVQNIDKYVQATEEYSKFQDFLKNQANQETAVSTTPNTTPVKQSQTEKAKRSEEDTQSKRKKDKAEAQTKKEAASNDEALIKAEQEYLKLLKQEVELTEKLNKARREYGENDERTSNAREELKINQQAQRDYKTAFADADIDVSDIYGYQETVGRAKRKTRNYELNAQDKANAQTEKEAKAEEKEYLSALRQRAKLNQEIAKARREYGNDSEHVQKPQRDLDEVTNTINQFENKVGEQYLQQMPERHKIFSENESELKKKREDIQKNNSKASAQKEKDDQASSEQKRIKNEQEYLKLIKQEPDLIAKANETRRKYGDNDWRTLYADEDVEANQNKQKAFEAEYTKKGLKVSDINGYQDAQNEAFRKFNINESKEQERIEKENDSSVQKNQSVSDKAAAEAVNNAAKEEKTLRVRITNAITANEKAYKEYLSAQADAYEKIENRGYGVGETKPTVADDEAVIGKKTAFDATVQTLNDLSNEARTSGVDVSDILSQYTKASDDTERAYNERIETENESIKVQEREKRSLQELITQLQRYKQTLIDKKGGMEVTGSGDVLSSTSSALDLQQRLTANPDGNKNQIAVDWAQANNISGITSYNDAIAKVKTNVSEAKNIVSDFNREIVSQNQNSQRETRLNNLKSQLYDYLRKNPKVNINLVDEVNSLQGGLNSPDAIENTKELGQQLSNLKVRAKETGAETENLVEQFANLFSQHLSTAIVMGSLNTLRQSLMMVYQNVLQVDTALTELKKITNLSGNDLSEYMTRAAESAQKLGVTLSSYVNSTADWKRLGYNDEDAENLATYSTLLANVGDGIDDVSTASSYLITTLQGFSELSAEDVERVVDEWDAVANTQPITAEAIGEILSRSASAMSAANNTFEETIALGTAAYSVVQNAESVGTSLKTISMYLRAASTEAEEAGVSTDGMAESTSALRSELKSLTGVDIMEDAAGTTFKSTYQILKEISAVWGNLTDVSQANVTNLLGGKRNANTISALLENFDTAESSIQSAANSTGVAWAENETYLDSIQGRLNQLASSFQALSVDILDSDIPKFFISLATAITKGADALIKFTGVAPTAIGIGTTVLGVANTSKSSAIYKKFDGTVAGAKTGASLMSGTLSSLVPKFSYAGNLGINGSNKIKLSDNTEDIENYVAQLAEVSDAQRNLVMSATDMSDGVKAAVKAAFGDTSSIKKYSGALVKNQMQSLVKGNVGEETINSVLESAGFMSSGKFTLVDAVDIDGNEKALEQLKQAIELNDNLKNSITASGQSVDAFSEQILAAVAMEQSDVTVKGEATLATYAYATAVNFAKQAALGFAAAIVSWAVTKVIDWVSNLKTHIEELKNELDNAKEANENAQSDVDAIQTKLDELNASLEEAGMDSIDNIVDPDEKNKIQSVNDALEAQLELKQKIADDAANEQNEAAAAVMNEDTVASLEKGITYKVFEYADGETYFKGDQITKAESLQEYSRKLNKLTEERNSTLAKNPNADTADLDEEIAKVKTKVETLGSEVSDQIDGFDTDAPNFSDYEEQYNAANAAITAANKALGYESGNIDLSESLTDEIENISKKRTASAYATLGEDSTDYTQEVSYSTLYSKYGNIDNTHRREIEWTNENKEKYSDFYQEQGNPKTSSKGIASSTNFEGVGEIAFTPLLQTEDGTIPLTNNEIQSYLQQVIQATSQMEGGATAENILAVDAAGLTTKVNGEATQVSNMIAAVQGQIVYGTELTAADVAAIAGSSADDIQNEFADSSNYIGHSMSEVQSVFASNGASVEDLVGAISSQVEDLDTDKLLELMTSFGEGLDSQGVEAIEKLWSVMGELGLSNSEEDLNTFISALQNLGYVSESVTEDINTTKDAITGAIDNLDNMQSGYQTCASAVEEYNKNGYVSVDTLQSLIALDPQYMSMLEMENGQLKINGETAQTLTDTYIELAKAELLANTLSQIAETNSLSKAQQVLGEVKAVTGDATAQIIAAGNKAAEEAYASDGFEGYVASREATAQLVKNYKLQDSLFDKLGNQSPSKIWGSGNNSSSSSSSKDSTTALDVWSTLTDAMEEYNTQGYITINTLKSLTSLEDKYTSLLTKNDVTGQLEMRTDAFKKLMMAELKAAQTSGDGASTKRYGEVLAWVTDNIDSQTISYYQLKTAIEGYSAALDDAAEKVEKMQSLWSNTKTANVKITQTARAGALDYEGTQAQISALDTVRQYSKYDPDLYEKVYNSDTGTLNLGQDTMKTAVVNSLRDAAAEAKSDNSEAAQAIAATYEKAANDIENDVISVQDYFEGLGSTVSAVNDEIDDFQSAWTDMDDIADEYNTYGGLSVDSMQKLLTMSDEYLDCLRLENGYLVINADAMKDMLVAKLTTRAYELNEKEETKEQAEILWAMIDQIKTNGISGIKGMTTEADKLESILSKIKDVFSSVLDIVNEINDNASNDLSTEADAWLDVIDERIDALNDENDAQERALELQKLQDAYDEAKANKSVRVYTSNGYEWQADESAVKEAETALNDKKRENKKEDEIESLNKLKEKIQEVTDAASSSWDDYQKKLYYTANFQNMTVDEMTSHLDTYKSSVESNMKAIQVATNVSNTVDNLTTFIETLEKVNDLINLLGSNGQTTSDGGFSGLYNTLKNAFTGEDGNIDISGGLTKLWDKAKTAVGNGTNAVSTAFKNGWNAIFGGSSTTEITAGEAKVTTSFGNFFSKIKTTASTSLSSIGNFFSSAWNGISTSTSTLMSDVGTFFSATFSGLSTVASEGLGAVVSTLSSLFTPIANGAMSIGSAISSGVISFFPSIFAGLGTLVTTVGTAMEGMMTAIGAALAAIPVAGWVAAAAVAVAAVALIASLVSVASSVSSTSVSEPTASFQAKKYAKGTRGVKNGQIANVDEEGEEIIVRNPDAGRMTYLEKGDGVIPSDTTDNLMELGENPISFISNALGEITGSQAAAVAMTDEWENRTDTGSAISQVAETANEIGEEIVGSYDGTWDEVREGFNKVLSDVEKAFNGAGFGNITTKVTTAFSTMARVLGLTTKTSTTSTSDLVDTISDEVYSTMNSMKSNFEDTWGAIASETGVDADTISSISSTMFSNMKTLVDNTLNSIKNNSSLTTDQVTELTNKMFTSMQTIYSSGWQKAYNTSSEMSAATASTVNSAYEQAKTTCTEQSANVEGILKNSWETLGGGAELTADEIRAEFGEAWDDTGDDAALMMQDLNDCFNPDVAASTEGIDNYKNYVTTTAGNGWTSIESGASTATSSIDSTFGSAWDNGTNTAVSNYADNIQWAMETRFNAINEACDTMVGKVKDGFGTANTEFEAAEKSATKATTDTSKATTTDSSSSGTSTLEKVVDTALCVAVPAYGVIKGIKAILGHANGVKDVKDPHYANVDEQGEELVVRQPASGRYTYLETGDGVVPADITSRLFEMGGDPNGWFHEQMSKYDSQQIVTSGGDNFSVSMGNIVVNNPVGCGSDLANELMRELPNAMAQRLNKRT